MALMMSRAARMALMAVVCGALQSPGRVEILAQVPSLRARLAAGARALRVVNLLMLFLLFVSCF